MSEAARAKSYQDWVFSKILVVVGIVILFSSLDFNAVAGSHIALVGVGTILSAIFVVLLGILKETKRD